MSFMADIALIGDKNSVNLAKAAGLDVYGVEKAEDAAHIIHKLAKSGTKVIFITDPVYEANSEAINRYKTKAFPAIISLPDSHGSTGIAMREIHANVEKAIGMDVL